jgi:hypothetical protein
MLRMLGITPEFKKDLAAVINKHSIENMSDTPDWILAEVAAQALYTFAYGSNTRENFYGRTKKSDFHIL